MRHITSEEIEALNITPVESLKWVREAFLIKETCILPPKISLHPRGNLLNNNMITFAVA